MYDKRAGFMPIKVVVRENYKHTFTTSIKYKVGSLDGRKNHKQNKKQSNATCKENEHLVMHIMYFRVSHEYEFVKNPRLVSICSTS